MPLQLAKQPARLSTKPFNTQFGPAGYSNAVKAFTALRIPRYRGFVRPVAVDAIYSRKIRALGIDAAINSARITGVEDENVFYFQPQDLDGTEYILVKTPKTVPSNIASGEQDKPLHTAILYYAGQRTAPREAVLVTPKMERVTYLSDSVTRPLMVPLLNAIDRDERVKDWDVCLRRLDRRRVVRELQWGWGSAEHHPDQFLQRVGLKTSTRPVSG